MKALWDSLVRTFVPWLVGIIIGGLASTGIPLDSKLEAQVTAALMLAASGLYYLAARLLEIYVSPKFGWLLGLAKAPEYRGKYGDYPEGGGHADERGI